MSWDEERARLERLGQQMESEAKSRIDRELGGTGNGLLFEELTRGQAGRSCRATERLIAAAREGRCRLLREQVRTCYALAPIFGGLSAWGFARGEFVIAGILAVATTWLLVIQPGRLRRRIALLQLQ